MTTSYLSPNTGRRVIAKTNRGEEIYLIDPPRPGEVVADAWAQTGRSMTQAMKQYQSKTTQ